SGRDGDLACALNWMSAWARAGALQSDDFNHTGKSMRKWALGSLSGAYMRLKFSSSRPLRMYWVTSLVAPRSMSVISLIFERKVFSAFTLSVARA
ncbi:alginate lyase family protein, partial [Pseudomonas aeruginosa]